MGSSGSYSTLPPGKHSQHDPSGPLTPHEAVIVYSVSDETEKGNDGLEVTQGPLWAFSFF